MFTGVYIWPFINEIGILRISLDISTMVKKLADKGIKRYKSICLKNFEFMWKGNHKLFYSPNGNASFQVYTYILNYCSCLFSGF